MFCKWHNLIFLWLNTYHVFCNMFFSIHSFVSKHFGGFTILTIVSGAKTNTGMWIMYFIILFLATLPNTETTGSYGNSTFSF